MSKQVYQFKDGDIVKFSRDYIRSTGDSEAGFIIGIVTSIKDMGSNRQIVYFDGRDATAGEFIPMKAINTNLYPADKKENE